MSFNTYQRLAKTTDIYPKESALICHVLGLTSEAGEVADKIKKVIRDNSGEFSTEKKLEIAYELGNVLWYISRIADDLGYGLNQIQELNLMKLDDRKNRNKLNGSGDYR